jgi:hypothetical protein
MSSEFTAEEDYRVVRKDPAIYWQFHCKRDCTQLQSSWISSRISSSISPSPGGGNAISGNTALSTVHGGDFRGEGSATGPNGETSTEAAGKTYKDEVSVDGTGHTSVVISVKLREPHSC